jgi:uncharacterized membrane protein YccC
MNEMSATKTSAHAASRATARLFDRRTENDDPRGQEGTDPPAGPASGTTISTISSVRAVVPHHKPLTLPNKFRRVLPDLGAIGLAARATAAGLAALYLAMWLELDAPFWAVGTVLIVAQPTRGEVLRKSFYRVLGTVLGAAAGIVLIAAFPQAPELFIAGLALWLGACSFISTLLREFRSYAASLAGFTAAIVALDAAANPTGVWEIAAARSSAITIGIICYGVVTALTAPATAKAEFRKRFAHAITSLARWGSTSLHTREGEPALPGRKMMADLLSLESLLKRACAEAPELRPRESRLRGAIAALLAFVSAAHRIDDHLRRGGKAAGKRRHELGERFAAAASLLDAAATAPEDAGLQDRALDMERDLWTAHVTDATERFLLDLLVDLAAALREALTAPALIDGRRVEDSRPVRFAYHRDLANAVLNGLRATLVMAVAGAFWIASAWPDGAGCMVFAAIVISLFATRENPAAFGLQSVFAIILCGPCGYILKFLIMPGLEGFDELAPAVAPFLAGTGLALSNPHTAAGAALFIPFLLALVNLTNQTSYDLAGFLNSGLAMLAGGGLGALFYLVMPPVDARWRARRVLEAIGRETLALGTTALPPPRAAWETRMYDRLVFVLPHLSPEERADAFTLLGMGRDLLHLRKLLQKDALPWKQARILSLALANLTTPRKVAKAVNILAEHRIPGAAALSAHATLGAVAEALASHGRFLHKPKGR